MHSINRFIFVLLAALSFGGANALASSGPETAATSEPRVALVIGNANYSAEAKLANPTNDVTMIGATLKKLGFDVILLTDANQKAMERAMVDFGERLSKAGPDATGLFYYAGHGVQVDGENYLVPVDAAIQREADVDIDAVPANLVLKQMAFAGSRVNIVILDACRDNPLATDFRSIAGAQGFAEIHTKPKGTFISYSTAPGEVAMDGGPDGHSPFAAALVEAMQVPGLDLPEVFQRVREHVLATTNERQTPWDSSSLVKSFYFVPPADGGGADLVAATQPALAKRGPAQRDAAAPAVKLAAATPLGETSAVRTAAPAGPAAAPASETAADMQLPAFVPTDHALFAKIGSRLRAAPLGNAAVVASLKLNAPLHAIGRSADGQWWQVKTPKGDAYVSAQLVSDFRIATAAPKPAAQPQLASMKTASAAQAAGSGSGIGFVDEAMDWLATTTGASGKAAAPATRATK